MPANRLFDALDNNDVRARVVAPPLPPASVTSFLGRLSLLHGAPFAYLVADEKLLPAESLKLFVIDPQWINALIGGALSVGRGETIRLLLNKTQAGNFIGDIVAEAQALRSRQRGHETPATRPTDGSVPSFAFSGFLLRSRILQAWPGLEVRAFRSAGRQDADELAMLRLDRVAADILFGLVDGQVSELELTQPPEGLHFAVKDSEKQPPFRGNAEERVLDMKDWAKTAKSSAEFAKERISNPLRFVFKIGG
jgi:hypothetical protein